MPQHKKKPERILSHIYGQPWTMTEDGLKTVIRVAEREGDIEALLSKRGEQLRETYKVEMFGSVAVIPIHGTVFRYSNIFNMISGGASLQMIAEDFRAALDNPEVSAIVLDVDSPGGQAAGINEFANLVYESRDQKTVIGYTGNQCASAAYWICAACSEVVCDATARLGSIGTVIGFKKEEDDTIEIVSTASPKKRPDPETEEGRNQILVVADDLTDVFIKSVAKFRSVDEKKVLADFGQGDVLVGEKAVKAGLADRIGSLEGVISKLRDNSNTQHRGITMSAQTKSGGKENPPTITAETISQNHPDIAEHFRKEGASAELARVKGVFSLKFPGHEETLSKMALDGETTAEQAALKLINLEQGKREKIAADRKEDGKEMPPISAGEAEGDDAEEEKAAVSAIIAGAESYY